jgi:hypothetical protein
MRIRLASLSLIAIALVLARARDARAQWDAPAPPWLDPPPAPDTIPTPDFGPPSLHVFAADGAHAGLSCPGDLRTPPQARVPDPTGGGPYVISVPVIATGCRGDAEIAVGGGMLHASVIATDHTDMPGPGGGRLGVGVVAIARTEAHDGGVRADIELVIEGVSVDARHPSHPSRLADQAPWSFERAGEIELGLPLPDDYHGWLRLGFTARYEGLLRWDVTPLAAEAYAWSASDVGADVRAHIEEEGGCFLWLYCWAGQTWDHGDDIDVLAHDLVAHARVAVERKPGGYAVCGEARVRNDLHAALAGSGNGMYVATGTVAPPPPEQVTPVCTPTIDPFPF